MVVRTWVEEGKNLAGNFFDLVGKCVPRCGARGKFFSRDLARDHFSWRATFTLLDVKLLRRRIDQM